MVHDCLHEFLVTGGGLMLEKRSVALGLLGALMVGSMIWAAAVMMPNRAGSEPLPISGQQAAAVSDGLVTDDEYAAAVEATIACIRDQRFTRVSEPQWDVTGKVLDWSFSFDISEKTHAQAVYRECDQLHLAAVDWYRALQNRPESAELDAAAEMLAECMRPVVDEGLDANSDVYGDQFRACSDEVSKETGIPNFAGR